MKKNYTTPVWAEIPTDLCDVLTASDPSSLELNDIPAEGDCYIWN